MQMTNESKSNIGVR